MSAFYDELISSVLFQENNMKTIIIFSSITAMLCSCGSYVTFCQGQGCKAPADLATGIIAETKNPSDKKSSYYQLREKEAQKKTWIENIFNRGENNGRY